MKTKLAKAPWPGKKPIVHKQVNLDLVKKTNDQYKPQRVILKHKYDELFSGAKEGDCFRCPDEATMCALARALRSYFKRKGIPVIVRQQLLTEDRIPRVWLVKFLKG